MARHGAASHDPADPPVSAKTARLRYVAAGRPGIRRVRCGAGFRYLTPHGRIVTDRETLSRIRTLAIPPAWTDVWIARDSAAHLQATGRDARGRKQYRYHPRWRDIRHQTKYDRLVPFARALPALRRRLRADLSDSALTRDKVIAAVIDLLQKTWLRIGNPEYARANRSFGLTTLRDGHVRIRGAELLFEFRGKSGVRQRVSLTDARLARVVRRCQELPGQDLFQYVDSDGRRRTITSADVNTYLREIMGAPFTAKDFRTWAGTVLAALALSELDPPTSSRRTQGTILRAVEKVAQSLSNTPSVCRACYIHPVVFDAYVAGTLRSRLETAPRRRGLSDEEAAVLGLLESSGDWRSALATSARAA